MKKIDGKMVMGIDIGSLTIKIVLFQNKTIIASIVEPSTYDFRVKGNQLVHEILKNNGLQLENIENIVLTGYGRHSLPEITENVITEISAHAIGVQYYYPKIRAIIDIGGQDSKVIKLDPETGNIIDFQMNDKCAAGTGRFLEVMAKSLQVDINDFGDLALQSNNPESISSMCTVFAESEVIGLFAHGAKKSDIAAGIHLSIAKRVGNMAKRLRIQEPLAFCGGVALNSAVKKSLEQELAMKISIPHNPQIIGALGAAIKAWKQIS